MPFYCGKLCFSPYFIIIFVGLGLKGKVLAFLSLLSMMEILRRCCNCVCQS